MAGFGNNMGESYDSQQRAKKAREKYAKIIASRKVKVLNKPIGSRVQSPDEQEKTMTMGKQPIAVYPLMGNMQKKGGMR